MSSYLQSLSQLPHCINILSTNINTRVAELAPYVGDYKFSALDYDFKGWLKCDGRTLFIQDYPTLFNVIGTAFGGDGEGTFRLPNCQGRVPAAIGASVGANHLLGGAAGYETHTLSVDEIPGHTHTVANVPFGTQTTNATTGGGVTAADETINTLTTSSVGGGQPHNNMQPTLFVGSLFIFGGYTHLHPTPEVIVD